MKELTYFENLFEGLRLKLYQNLDSIFEDARYIVINPDLHTNIRKICDIPDEQRPSIFGIELRLNNSLAPTDVKVVWYDKDARPVYYKIDDTVKYEHDIIAHILEKKEQDKKCTCTTCKCSDSTGDITVNKDADKKEITLTVNGSVVYNDYI